MVAAWCLGCVERHRGDETFQTRDKKDQSNRSKIGCIYIIYIYTYIYIYIYILHSVHSNCNYTVVLSDLPLKLVHCLFV